MRGAIKYGIPASVGLGTAGYAASQDEDLGSTALAGLTGAGGGALGLLGARALAGKFAPLFATKAQAAADRVTDYAARRPSTLDTKKQGFRANRARDLAEMLTQAATVGTNPNFLRGSQYAAAAGLVPASALTAGYAGIAAGGVPGALGVPGFTQIDPESYGSSNSPGARYKASTAQYS